MERCDEIRAWLGAFADGELGRSDRRQVEAHLAACPRCRSALEEIRALEAALVDEARAAEPPEEYFASLPDRVRARFDFDAAERGWRRIGAREPARRRPTPMAARAWFRLALGTATVLLVALVIRVTQQSPVRPRSIQVRVDKLSGEIPPRPEERLAEEPGDAAPERRPSPAPVARAPGPPEEVADALPPPSVEAAPVPERIADSGVPGRTDRVSARALADTLVSWGRDLAALLAAAETPTGSAEPELLELEVAETPAAPSLSKAATPEDGGPSAPPIGPADLLLREADPSLSDSAWIRGWRGEARRLADLALRAPAPERCRVALAAYRRLERRGGRQIFAAATERLAAFAPDRDRIEALLRCLGP